jgi:cephalosporin-C deacetylase-like acetyl esterase
MRTLPYVPIAFCAVIAVAADPVMPPANRVLADYFSREVATLEGQPLPRSQTLQEWESQRTILRGQFAEMLGLQPMPERTPLNPVKTGEVTGEGFVAEKLHFQSQPGLYVTANLYRPAKVEGKLPAILYVCGHSEMKAKDGTVLGNKTGYQHHGAWFARHGYVCLVIDTIQLGEISGVHHGTYRMDRWWWLSRGYTPAGVEAWNGIRAIDYLVSRPEVDPERIGVTGRSGGGAYSWFIAALDDRIKVAVPTAGITTLRNHVIDGTVEGHCDCMFFVNTYRWDYDRLAALVALRPLLIANTDKDTIFPLDGVYAIYSSVRGLYRSLGAEGKIGLQIAEGPHKDTQSLNTGAFAWFERWLKGVDLLATFDDAAKKTLEPEPLRVFSELPPDERNSRIDSEFVPAAKSPNLPDDRETWARQQDIWLAALRAKSFRGWPTEPAPLDLHEAGSVEHDGVTMHAWDFTPQAPFTLRLWIAHRTGLTANEIKLVVLNALDAEGWQQFSRMAAGNFPTLFPESARAGADGNGFAEEKKMYATQPWAMAYVAPRGVGLTAWSGPAKAQIHRLRRFYLLGQTLDSMQVWDLRRTIQALRSTGFGKPTLWLQGNSAMGVNALYASLFEPNISRLDLHDPPASHATGPIYLNVLKTLDTPQAVALATARSKVRIFSPDSNAWHYASSIAQQFGSKGSFEVRSSATTE